MLPGVYWGEEQESPAILETYANIYLREEIQAAGVLENISHFSRLIDATTLISGQWLNYSKLSSDIEVPKETVRRHISILQDTLLIHRLASFKPRHKRSRRVSQRDKLLLLKLFAHFSRFVDRSALLKN